MKKLLGFLAIALVMAATIACEGKPGKDGLNAEPVNWFTGDFEIFPESWNFVEVEDENWFLYEYKFDVSELDKFVFKEGAVLCYLVQDIVEKGKETTRHILLPHTVYGEVILNEVNPDTGEPFWFPFSENYSCELSEGFINFTVRFSYWDPDKQPPYRLFHVVMLW